VKGGEPQNPRLPVVDGLPSQCGSAYLHVPPWFRKESDGLHEKIPQNRSHGRPIMLYNMRQIDRFQRCEMTSLDKIIEYLREQGALYDRVKR
jgi:hypothetical protein